MVLPRSGDQLGPAAESLLSEPGDGGRASPRCNGGSRGTGPRDRRGSPERAAIARRLASIRSARSSPCRSGRWRSGLNRRSRRSRSTRLEAVRALPAPKAGPGGGSSRASGRGAARSRRSPERPRPPSSSYFAPPMPWRKMSPSRSLANMVVVRALVRSRIPREGRFWRSRTAQQASRSGPSGNSRNGSASPAIRSCHRRAELAGHQGAATGGPSAPGPEGGFQPIAVLRQARGPGGGGCGCRARPGSGGARRCGRPGTGAGGPAGARRTRGTPRSRRRRSGAPRRCATPRSFQGAAGDREPHPDAVVRPAAWRARGQNSSIKGSAT